MPGPFSAGDSTYAFFRAFVMPEPAQILLILV